MVQDEVAAVGMVWEVISRDFWGYLIADAVLSGFAILTWLLLVYVVLKRFNHWPLTLKFKWWIKLAQGAALGTLAVLLSVLPIWLGRGFSAGVGWEPFNYANPQAKAALTWAFFAVQSLAEEFVFRAVGLVLLAVLLFWLIGWVLHPKRRRDDWTNPQAQRFVKFSWLASGLLANLVVSGAFAFVHHNNPGATLLSTLNVGLAGLVLGQLCWQQGTVHGAWSWHLMWNALLASLGLPVSGYAMAPANGGLGFSGARAGILSGGSFGPEGSIVCSVVLSAMFGLLLWHAWRGIRQSEVAAAQPESIAPQATKRLPWF